jgi:hypothetical protein
MGNDWLWDSQALGDRNNWLWGSGVSGAWLWGFLNDADSQLWGRDRLWQQSTRWRNNNWNWLTTEDNIWMWASSNWMRKIWDINNISWSREIWEESDWRDWLWNIGAWLTDWRNSAGQWSVMDWLNELQDQRNDDVLRSSQQRRVRGSRRWRGTRR